MNLRPLALVVGLCCAACSHDTKSRTTPPPSEPAPAEAPPLVSEEPTPEELLSRCEANNREACEKLTARFQYNKSPSSRTGFVERACTAGIGSACAVQAFKLFEVVDDPMGAAGMFTRALPLLLRGCELRDATSCVALARFLRTGGPAGIELPRALDALTRNCDALSGETCTELGLMHAKGLGVARNEARAVKLWERACGSGETVACSLLGEVNARSESATPEMLRDAASALAASCEAGGDRIGCEALGDMYADGHGVARDDRKAAALYARAAGAQFRRAILHGQGRGGVGEDALKGPNSCLGRQPWCDYVLGLYVAHPDLPINGTRARARFAEQCGRQVAEACTAQAALEGSGHGLDAYTPLDIEAVLLLFERACQGGHAPACELPRKAVAEMERLCSHKQALPLQPYCYGVGLAALHGIGAQKDPRRARKFFEKACEMLVVPACQHLQDMSR